MCVALEQVASYFTDVTLQYPRAPIFMYVWLNLDMLLIFQILSKLIIGLPIDY